MDITTDLIKELRDATGVSVMQCKKALEEAEGDMEKAKMILRKQSATAASKKGDRTLAAGVIGSYVHSSGTVGGLVELCSETDFVSKNTEFSTLARDIAMHVVATNPRYLSQADVPEAEKQKFMEVFAAELEGKPEDIKAKIAEGKLGSYYKEVCLLDQPFIKNPDMTINGLVQAAIQKFGEKVELVRYVRFGVLEE